MEERCKKGAGNERRFGGRAEAGERSQSGNGGGWRAKGRGGENQGGRRAAGDGGGGAREGREVRDGGKGAAGRQGGEASGKGGARRARPSSSMVEPSRRSPSRERRARGKRAIRRPDWAPRRLVADRSHLRGGLCLGGSRATERGLEQRIVGRVSRGHSGGRLRSRDRAAGCRALRPHLASEGSSRPRRPWAATARPAQKRSGQVSLGSASPGLLERALASPPPSASPLRPFGASDECWHTRAECGRILKWRSRRPVGKR